jgi:hypothetical protein
MPVAIIDFPEEEETLPFRDNQSGKPVNISSKIAPNDHTS